MNSSGHLPKYSVEMDRVPVDAGLEALRTVRSGVDPNLTAAGAISGKVTYDETPSAATTQKITTTPDRAKRVQRKRLLCCPAAYRQLHGWKVSS